MTTERSAAIFCCNCGHKQEMHTSINEEATPQAGCISICINCAQISIFKDDLTLRNITPGELKEIALNHPREHYQLMMATELISQRIKQN